MAKQQLPVVFYLAVSDLRCLAAKPNIAQYQLTQPARIAPCGPDALLFIHALRSKDSFLPF
jgi:predicted RNA-binding protein with PUA domain